MENSGKQNPKMGFKSPPSRGGNQACSSLQQFLRLFDRFRALKIDIPVLMPRKLTIGKTSKISIFQRKTGRWIVSWYDQHGTRRNPSFATLKEAEARSITTSRPGRTLVSGLVSSAQCTSKLDGKPAGPPVLQSSLWTVSR